MRIAIIGSKGIPCKEGGVEKHVEELATRLVKKGHQVIVYAQTGYTHKRINKYKGVDLIYPPYLPTKNLKAISHTFLSLLHLLFKKVDIIHIHSIGPSLLAGIPRLLKKKAKTIVTFHSRDHFNQKWGIFARSCLKMGEWTAVHLPHATITVSRNLLYFCQKKYPDQNVVYIPNGAHLDHPLKPQRIKKWGLADNSYILSVSRLIPLKKIHCLISAYLKLNFNKKLVIVGSGPEKDKTYVQYLKHLAQKNKNIIFTGRQNGKTLQELFSNAYLYVLPSEVEGLSISLLEAMAASRCTLVSDIVENRETIGDVGYTFQVNNNKDLQEKLQFLNNHPELVLRSGRQARNRVQKLYNWNSIVVKTINLYQTLRTKEHLDVKTLPRPVSS